MKYLSLVINFETGYWSLSDILSMLEGGNQRTVKYFMEKVVYFLRDVVRATICGSVGPVI